jgi:hypothetical protein
MFVRVKSWVRTFAAWEPAQWRGLWVAVGAVLASLGLGQWVADLDGHVQAFITAASLLVPYLQGLWTRQAVSPAIKVEGLENALEAATGRHAAPEQPGTIGVPRTEPYRD